MLRSLSRVIAGLSLLLTAGLAQTAPILIVDGTGKLTGARNVDVGGILYHVDFRDGTCVGLFSGCDTPVTDFAFTTSADASAAGAALLAQVFLDGVQGQFDTNPSLVAGCSNSIFLCEALIPYAMNQIPGFDGVHIGDVQNFINQAQDKVTDVNTFRNGDTTTTASNDAVWAVFSRASVPEPPTYACLLLAGIALAMSRRRNRNRAGQHQRL